MKFKRLIAFLGLVAIGLGVLITQGSSEPAHYTGTPKSVVREIQKAYDYEVEAAQQQAREIVAYVKAREMEEIVSYVKAVQMNEIVSYIQAVQSQEFEAIVSYVRSVTPVVLPNRRPSPPANNNNRQQTYNSNPGDFLSCVRNRESGGNYSIYNSGGSGAAGAYQFLPSTWDSVAKSIGRYDLVGVSPANASPADQDMMAQALYSQSGSAPWETRGSCGG